MDLENLQQEQAAAQMGVARTTVQLIYNNARRKLADCLVNGKRLVIEGGDVALCERHAQSPRTRTLLPQRLPEASKISAENEKTVAFATVFSLFFVIEHIAVQRVFLRRFRRKLP